MAVDVAVGVLLGLLAWEFTVHARKQESGWWLVVLLVVVGLALEHACG